MGHYDDASDEMYAEQRRLRLKTGRVTIEQRLRTRAEAMRLMGLHGYDVLEEAIEHLREQS